MRRPSEVLGLRWNDVDWDAGRLRINSSKTGLRFCPIFPEVLPILAEAFEIADDGAEYCISRYRQGANLGTEAKQIIERAGLVPWVKPFVNLRSSRRTELQERFPDHVINGWLGHSGAVAAKHYVQTTNEHWDQAKGVCSQTGSHTLSNHQLSGAIMETKKPRKLQGSDGYRLPVMGQLATPLGHEQPSEMRGNSHAEPNCPIQVPIPADELLSLWQSMSDEARAELLDLARGLASHREQEAQFD